MKNIFKLILLSILLVFNSCEKDEDTSGIDQDVATFIEQVMDYWYLWNDSIPYVDYKNYDDPQDFVDAMTASLDKWSFIDNSEDVNAYFQEGEDFGYGFYLGWDSEEVSLASTLRVMFVYNNTKAYEAGIERGWTILEMNDTPVLEITSFDDFFSSESGSLSFKFETNDGETKTLNLSNESYYMNGVLFEDTYTINSNKVGYFVYQSFLGYSESELLASINNFIAEDVDDLIIDLRFNQGGYISIAQQLADILVPASKEGATFFEMKHNDDRSIDYDTTYTFNSSSQNMDLDRIFFITNEYTASAGELVINGLSPHMEVVTIGATTYGKPVAMYGFESLGWSFYPVTAKSINASGYGDYYDGIAPDMYVYDDFHYNWGDSEEPALSQAFSYITTGSFSAVSTESLKTSTFKDRTVGGQFNRNLLIRK